MAGSALAYECMHDSNWVLGNHTLCDRMHRSATHNNFFVWPYSTKIIKIYKCFALPGTSDFPKPLVLRKWFLINVADMPDLDLLNII